MSTPLLPMAESGRFVQPNVFDLAPAFCRDPSLLKAPGVDPHKLVATMIEATLNGLGTTAESIKNAHVPGMDSLMLWRGNQQDGDPMIRIFYTRPGEHPLNRFYDPQHDFNCRPHDHRFGLGIVPLFGPLLHVRYEKTTAATKHRYHAWQFTSAYLTGTYGLGNMGTQMFNTPEADMLVAGEAVAMRDGDIHSLTTYEAMLPRETAWAVFEGGNIDKKPTMYSRDTDPQLDSTELYKPVKEAYVRKKLERTLKKMQAGAFASFQS